MAMKRTMAVLGVALVGALTSASAQVTFRHFKSIDLSSYFPPNGPQGNLVSDVAFDGADLYVAGMANLSGIRNVGVLKVSNVLSLDANALRYSPLISLEQTWWRSSYIVYHDGFLYLGTGLGDGTNNPERTGIRKFTTAGLPVGNWNLNGVVAPSIVMPRDLSGSGRAECIEIDPGYRSGDVGYQSSDSEHQGSEPSLAVLARERGIIFRRDFATGNALPNILCLPVLECQPRNNPDTTGMRDITFSPEGDAYLRVDNSIFYARREADNIVQSNIACQIFNFRSDSAFQILINIHYLRTPTGVNFLIYNRRGTASPLNRVFIATGSGANWTPFTELLGNEPLPNGSTPNPFNSNIFNFTSGFGPDPSRGDVNADGIVDDADLLAVLFEFGSSNAAADANSDGIVDDADLLIVLFNFGSSPRAQYLFVVNGDLSLDERGNIAADYDRLDIYRVDVN